MTRPDKIFGHRLLMTPIASYVGFAAMLYGGYLLCTGAASLLWLLPMLFFTLWILMGVTVGLHRLFCHAAFKTSKFWHWTFGILGTLAVYGSTVQWAGMHSSHHKYSDTDKDPHYTGWEYLFWKKNRPTTFNRRVISRLYRNPMHRFLHNYYSLVVAGAVLGLLAFGVNALLFCYLIPLGWLHFVGSAHQVFAHDSEGPLDQGWLEFLLFTGGEWEHGHHHARPKDTRFGRFDLGQYVIKVIRTRNVRGKHQTPVRV
jgi:stearoyl-CoA desaturase (delta-9 desaturase)